MRKLYFSEKQVDETFKHVSFSESKPLNQRSSSWIDESYRSLTTVEIEILEKQGNSATDWSQIRVDYSFSPEFVHQCKFYGINNIGSFKSGCLVHHELALPLGLFNSTFVSCDIGGSVAIHNVSYLANYQIEHEVLLFNIQEMMVTPTAKFGNGVVKEGETESSRIWIEVANENRRRAVIPFEGMKVADAYIWAKYRGDSELQKKLVQLTENEFNTRSGFKGRVGAKTVIKNAGMIKDVNIGRGAYIKGINKLKNLTIQSNEQAPTQIGEGVELVNGIIGSNNRIFYGVKAVRFITGENVSLKYGARLINSILGENSTISCCEVLNTIIYPAHEQHHNNSFLCAATLMGQSNVAAGANLGSNHTSRQYDGEMVAGRGFWPGLSVSLKYNCKFASFTLLSKASYPYEINNPFPFALIANNEKTNSLQIMPAYWLLYNLYALVRNEQKYSERDLRQNKLQPFEVAFLAPDTVQEMLKACTLLDDYFVRAFSEEQLANWNELKYLSPSNLKKLQEEIGAVHVLANEVESGKRDVVLLKPLQAYIAYREAIHYYAIRTLVTTLKPSEIPVSQKSYTTSINYPEKWINLGGQLITSDELEVLFTLIKQNALESWEGVHQYYQKCATSYGVNQVQFAWYCLASLYPSPFSIETFISWCHEAILIQRNYVERAKQSRKKDFEQPFRTMMYDTIEEQESVLGTLESDTILQNYATYGYKLCKEIADFITESEALNV